jgi:hypothetical protein
MALRERLGSLFGLKVVASAAVAVALLAGSPAKADGDIRIILGLPATIGFVFGLPNRHYRDRDYRETRDYRSKRRVAYDDGYRHGRNDRWSRDRRRDDRRYRHDRHRGRHYDRHRGSTYEADNHHP